MHQLLTHTSGLGDYTQTQAFAGQWRTWTSVTEVFNWITEIIRGMSPACTPGSGYQYSNTGFYMLGAIVAQVSGQSYYDYIHQHIFSPAGMTRSGASLTRLTKRAEQASNIPATSRPGSMTRPGPAARPW